jgi:signal peptidase I
MKKTIIENLKTLVFAFVVAIIIRTFLFQPFYIPSSSMEETLLVGDRLFVTKFSYGYSKHSFPFSLGFFENRILYSVPKRGDVIVFKTPEDNDTDYIKRLIGLPGDKIQMKEGVLYINNQPVKRQLIKKGLVLCGGQKVQSIFYKETLENNKSYVAAYAEQHSSKNTDVYIIPSDKYFFMGDNRDCSLDSRYLNHVGYVDKINLVGKAQLLFFSNNETIGNFFTFWRWPQSIRFNRILRFIE